MRPTHLSMLSRIAPFAVYLVLLAIEGQAHLLFPDLDARWLYPLKIALVAGVLATFRLQYVELRGFQFSVRDSTLSIGAGLLVFLVWIGLDAPWAVIGEPGAGYDPRDNGEVDWLLAGFRLAGAALVVPLMEELFWRSFLMRWVVASNFLSVKPADVTWTAIWVSSIVFGFEHHQWLAGIFAGLIYAWLYRRTGHIYYAIFAHAITNGVLGAWVLSSGEWRYW